MPKGSRNGGEINAETYQKSMQKPVAKEMRKIMKKHVFPMCKNRFLIGRYSKFEVLQGECADLKSHQKTIKMRSESIPKSMEKRDKLHVRTGDAKKHGKASKMDPKRKPKSGEKWKSVGKKTMRKKM